MVNTIDIWSIVDQFWRSCLSCCLAGLAIDAMYMCHVESLLIEIGTLRGAVLADNTCIEKMIVEQTEYLLDMRPAMGNGYGSSKEIAR